jgi:hypothetical protein
VLLNLQAAVEPCAAAGRLATDRAARSMDQSQVYSLLLAKNHLGETFFIDAHGELATISLF